MLDRKVGPRITNDFDLKIRNVEHSILENGLEVFELNSGTQEIIKIELVFRSGRIQEKKPAVAKAAIKLLREASKSRTAEQTAYTFDYYGAVFKAECNMEFSSVSLVCLNQHLDKLWPIWLDTILNPAFEEEELTKYKELVSKNLSDQLSKNDVIAYRVFTEELYGCKHPYGYNTEVQDVLSLTSQDIKSYFEENCKLGNAFLILSGKYNDTLRSMILKDLEGVDRRHKPSSVVFPQTQSFIGTKLVKTKNDLQTSIKIGSLWVPRDHPDYVSLKILNTVLGGYFGSRLMKNIREEKGYTYGIYSSFDVWMQGGYFYVSTDVGTEYLNQTIQEIYKEIKIIKSVEINNIELKMVKNYLLGQSLNLIDGPFATAQLVKSLRAKNLELSRFESSIEEIKTIEAKHLLSLANQYLKEEEFTIVIVGKN